MRSVWARSLARAQRWEEEVLVLKTEMIRVLTFMDHKASWWREQSSLRTDITDDEVKAGIVAYAEKQAYLREDLARSFASQWLGLFQMYGEDVPKQWPIKYRNVPILPRHITPRRHRTNAYRQLVTYLHEN